MVRLLRHLEELQERRVRLSAAALIVAGLALALTIGGCRSSGPDGFAHASETRPAMGTLLEIQLYGPEGAAVDEILDGCFTLVGELETIFTSWDEASPLNRLNAQSGLGPVEVPAALVSILRDAQRLGAETAGSFDVTVGPLLDLWRDAERDGAVPDDAVVEAVRRRVDASEIVIDERGRVALPRGASLNLGGIGKGWALDRVAERLRARGIDRALLSFGGSSVLALGAPPGGERWNVLVRTRDGEVIGVVSLRDQHLSVSEGVRRGAHDRWPPLRARRRPAQRLAGRGCAAQRGGGRAWRSRRSLEHGAAHPLARGLRERVARRRRARAPLRRRAGRHPLVRLLPCHALPPGSGAVSCATRCRQAPAP